VGVSLGLTTVVCMQINGMGPNAGSLSSESEFPCNQPGRVLPLIVRRWTHLGHPRRHALTPCMRAGHACACARGELRTQTQHFHGTVDLTIPYRLGEQSVERYRDDIGGCTGAGAIVFRNGSATCENWKGCKDGAEVTFCSIQGQGHAWPGCFDGCSAATQDINATREMWYFFKRMSGF
jgi:hypothetical protein